MPSYENQHAELGAAADREIAALKARITELESATPPVEPPPTGGQAITVTVTDQQATSLRVNWTEVAGSTGYVTTRLANAAQPEWSNSDNPDPASARSRELLYLKPGVAYTVTVEALPSGAEATATGSTTGTTTGTTPPPVTEPPPVVTPPTPGTGRANLGYLVMPEPTKWPNELARMVESGAEWVQFSGAASSDQYLTYCREAKEAGLKVWVGKASLPNNGGWTDGQFNSENAKWLTEVSRKLGRYVDLWRVFNEHTGMDFRTNKGLPNRYLTWDGADTYLERFRQAMASARQAIRAGGSTAPVTTTPFGYPVNDAIYNMWVKFWDGIGSSCDVIAIHAYPELNPDNVAKIPVYMNRLALRYGKPVAIGEFGIPNTNAYGGDTGAGKSIVAQMQAVASAKPFAATVFQLRDRTGLDHEGKFGVLNTDGSKKTYYNAVATEMKRLNR